MWLAFHIVGYIAIGLVIAEQVPRVKVARRQSRHNAVMARIAQLEVSTGLGIDYAKEWIAQQPKRTRDDYLPMSGTWWCYGCGEWHQAQGYGFHKLCSKARPK